MYKLNLKALLFMQTILYYMTYKTWTCIIGLLLNASRQQTPYMDDHVHSLHKSSINVSAAFIVNNPSQDSLSTVTTTAYRVYLYHLLELGIVISFNI